MSLPKTIQLFVSCFVLCLLVQSCNSQENKKDFKFKSQKDYDEMMIESHKKFNQDLEVKIEQYMDSSKMNFQRTGSGMAYAILQKGSGVKPKVGNEVRIKYQLRFLNGDAVFGYEDVQNLSFFIEKSDVETGLHEAIKLMQVGEKSEFIFPPHLAFGISGNRKGIPPQSTLIYTIELLAVR